MQGGGKAQSSGIAKSPSITELIAKAVKTHVDESIAKVNDAMSTINGKIEDMEGQRKKKTLQTPRLTRTNPKRRWIAWENSLRSWQEGGHRRQRQLRQ